MAAIAQSTSANSTSNDRGIGGVVQQYLWNWQGQQLSVVYESLGEGLPVLLLPAFSTVSSRSEMRGIAELLAPQFQSVAVDWPGFGGSERLPLNYQPALYHQFLQDFVKTVFNKPIAVVAAGHAAGYAMQLAQQQPPLWSRVVLVAPTWRGPLPTMMGKHQGWFGTLRELVRSPIIGQALYRLNTAPSFLRFMYQSHVFADPAILTPSFMQQKWQITQQPGARFAPAAFVTGALDPVQNQADFLAWFQPPSVPVMVVIGEQTPPKSRAEMDVLATLPGVQTQIFPGSLGMHEEHPAQLAQAVLSFLSA